MMSLSKRVRDDVRIWWRFRSYSRTFSLAALLLPARVRLPVAAVYLLCRRIDQIADEDVLIHGPQHAQAALDELQRSLLQVFGGGHAAGWIWPRLMEVSRERTLDATPFVELIDGARWDVDGRPIDTLHDLIHYSDLVGGSIGPIMLPFLLDDERARAELAEPARALGIAMQVTNILRDVGEDWAIRRRIYLPASLLAQADLTLEDLVRRPEPPDEYIDLLECLMHEAERRFAASEPYVNALPSRSANTIRAAATMYREILNEIRCNGYDNLRRRAVVPLHRKGAVLLGDGYAARKKRLRRRHHILAEG